MADMVLLKCETGSKAAVVLCPECGRVSRQILSIPYSPNRVTDLIRAHTCPVCESVYERCNPNLAGSWLAAFARFNRNAYEYNESVKADYANKKTSEKKESANNITSSLITPYIDPNWKTLFLTNILERGESYFNKGRVDIVSQSNNNISGTVRGSELYYVRISFNNGLISSMHCTCPYASSGAKCKHEAAMLFAIKSDESKGTISDLKKAKTENASSNQTNSPQSYDFNPLTSTLSQVAEKRTDELKREAVPSSNKPKDDPVAKRERASSVPSTNTAPVDPKGKSLNSIKIPSSKSEDTHNYPNEDLDRKIEYWKRELLDTGKRNKMINYRETKRSTLRILEPEAVELFNRLAFSEKPLTFQKPINKDTDLRTYSIIALMETLSYTLNVQVGDIKTAGTIIEREKTLKNLRSKAKLAQEEQGTNILYLSFGFIYWRSQNRDSSPWLKAPLLMMPATLSIKSLNAPYTLSRYDDEIEVNPTLDYLFSTEYNINLPKFELKNKDSFDDYLREIEEIVDKRGWKVAREVSLGLLSFLKISMYHDLNNNRERMIKHPVLKAMAGDRKSLMDIPAEAEHFDFDAVRPEEWHEVVDSDSSQEEAILLSKLGISFVMQGPPGTGKSQTITNIIAEALADKKKVLFVSEKAAALEVVLKRLTEAKLDDFCLSLHNYKTNKKEIIDSIGANLDLQSEYIDRTELNELTELFHDRAFLTQYADELHQIIEPLGESIYMVFGKLSKLENATVVSFRMENPKSVSKEQYLSLLYVLDAFEKALHNLGGPLNANPWYNTTVKSAGQVFKQQMIRDTGLLSVKLKELDGKIKKFNSEYQADVGTTWNSLDKSIAAINTALDLPLFPYWWSDIAKNETLIKNVRKEAGEQKSLILPMERNRAVFYDSVLDAPLDDWIKRAKTIFDSYHGIGYRKEELGEHYLALAMERADETKRLRSDLELLSAQYKKVAEELGLCEVDSIQNVSVANNVLEILSRKPAFLERVWFCAENNEAALRIVDDASEHASNVNKLSRAIASVWLETVKSLDIEEIGGTFLDQYGWIYADETDTDSIEDRLTTYKKSAQDLYDKISKITKAHTKAVELLGVPHADNLEGFRSLSTLLRRASDVPYLETEWFDVRKNGAAQPLLEEALAHNAIIKEKTNTILDKWEPEALNMEEEALAMLGRFKTEHVGAFHKMKSGYKEDIKKIRLLSKEVGKTIDESEVIPFLQMLKEIHDEKQWYKDNQDLLAALAGSYFRGANTDWETVKRGMIIANEFANDYPYANIPEDVISAIQRSGSSIQGAAEIKELATTLSEENLAECQTLLKTASYVDQSAADSSFHETILPQILNFQEICIAQEGQISRLQAHHVSSEKITCKELRELLANMRQLQKEEKWFLENNERMNYLLASKNRGVDSNFDEIGRGLVFAKEVTTLFSDKVPDTLISVLCKDEMPSVSTMAVTQLSEDIIDGLRQKLQAIAPYISSETDSLRGSVIPRITAWITNTSELESLNTEIKPYCINDDSSPEQYLLALSSAAQVRNLRDQILEREADLAKQLEGRYQGIDTDWTTIENEIQQVRSFIGSYKSSITPTFIEIICDDKEIRGEVKKAIGELQSISDEIYRPYEVFAGYFEESEDIKSLDFDKLSDRYDKCLNGFGELNKWLDYADARADCDANGLSSFTAAIAQKNNTVEDVKNAFERGFYMQWLSATVEDVPAVQNFRRRVHEQRKERFINLDTKQYGISRKRIRDEIIRSFPSKDGMMRAGSELQILTHEMEKKRRIMPLRKLFQSIPNLLLTLKPCLMMSPLSVAYFLDANLYKFDMVIFDEASQIFPQDAIGAIFRAKQVIIAGDTKQLPPTNFFSANTSNSSEGYDDDEGYDDEVYDSILEETTNVLPNRTLLWHYRSKHEHLIAFSNQEIYRNNLVTFPSSNEGEPDTGVEFVYVKDGYYEPSPKNYNTLEAVRCVELVKEHIEKHPKRSLGIIAFSEKQQQAIALEIQRFREKNPEYEDFFAEGKEDEFFVKNLENVQGDERDTIFFSVGYARTKEQIANGKPMSMRFGPLGLQGGERRLNVAITRAKINVKLISSILPSDIDLNKTESEGIRMLRAYIEFAMNGDVTLSSAHKVNRPDDFVDAIAQFIRDHGFKVRQYIGCSGYKIDIAVQHPSETIEQFVAGIECDGLSYASAKTARDRDRLRSTVLEKMGWNLYRVWSAEWYKNPEIEGQKLVEFIQGAIAKCDKKVKALENEKAHAEEEKRLELEKARAAIEAEERKKQHEREKQEADRKAQLEAAERKKREEAEKKAAKLKAEQEAAQKREEERRNAEEKERKENAAKLQSDELSWVQRNASIYHKTYGPGIITLITKDRITVKFGVNQRVFGYPSAILNGLLYKPGTQDHSSPDNKKSSGQDWPQVGAGVEHVVYGHGTISKIDGNHLIVQFDSEKKKFILPEAIEKGFLRQSTEAVQKQAISEKPKYEQLKMPLDKKSSDNKKINNSQRLVDELKGAGFTVIDNRLLSSIIWVIYVGGKKTAFEKIVSKYNVQYSLERRGALATRNVPAWRIMLN